MKNEKIKVILVEDNREQRRLMVDLLNADPNFDCIGSFDNYDSDTLSRIKARCPDVLLMDIEIHANRQAGLEALQKLKKMEELADTKMLIWTKYNNQANILKAFIEKADGFMDKNLGYSNLLNDITKAYEGELIMSQQIQKTIIDLFRNPLKFGEELTDKEKEVLKLQAQGYTQQKMADELGITVNGVKKRFESIYGKKVKMCDDVRVLFLDLLLRILGEN